MALTQKEIEEGRKYYKSIVAQQEAAKKQKEQPAAPSNSPSFVEMTKQIFGDIKNIGSDFSERVGNARESLAATKRGEQTGAEFGFQVLGEAGGVVGDALGRGLTSAGRVANKAFDMATPDAIENPIRKGAKVLGDVALSTVVDPITAKYGEFEKNNPRAARNINAGANVLSAIPIIAAEAKGVQAGAKAAGKVVDAAPGMAKSAASDFKAAQRVKHIDELEDTYIEIATQTKSSKNALDNAARKQRFLDEAGTDGAAAPRILAESGIIPNQKGAVIDSAQQADDFMYSTIELNKLGKDAIKAIDPEVGPISLAELEQDALARARTTKNIDSGNIDALEAHIHDAFASLSKRYGDSIPLSKADEIKTARFGKAPFDSTKPLLGDANYIVGKTMQKIVESKATQAGFNDVAQFNRFIGDRIAAADFLRSLNGRKVMGGQLGKYSLKIGGGIAGAAGGGTLGSVLGMVAGDALGDLLVSTSIAGPVKRMVLNNLKVQHPDVYKKTMDWLMKKKLLPEQLMLPPGKAGMTGGQIELGPGKDTSGVRPLTPEEAWKLKIQENTPGRKLLPAPRTIYAEPTTRGSSSSVIQPPGRVRLYPVEPELPMSQDPKWRKKKR